MSLINTVAAVPMSEICAYRRDRKHVVVASVVSPVSSFGIGGWRDPLGLLLNEVMLEGQLIHPSGAEEDRETPKFFGVERTRALARRIDEAFARAGPPDTRDESYDEWVRSELGRAAEAVRTAARRGEAALTAWESFAPTRLRIRVRGPGEPVAPPLALPPPIVIAGCVAGGILAAALWRQRRMRLRVR